MKKIHFIRHGITEGNLKRWHYGWADIPLAPEGMEKLERLREENIYPRPEKATYYTSGMLRAEQTFEIIYGKREHKVAEKMKEFPTWIPEPGRGYSVTLDAKEGASYEDI